MNRRRQPDIPLPARMAALMVFFMLAGIAGTCIWILGRAV